MCKLEGLKAYRTSRGLTVERLARTLDMSVSYVSQIENGHAAPALGFMRKLKTAYPDINIDRVFFSNVMSEVD